MLMCAMESEKHGILCAEAWLATKGTQHDTPESNNKLAMNFRNAHVWFFRVH